MANSIIFGDIAPVPGTTDANYTAVSVLGEVPNPTFVVLYADIADSDRGKGNVGLVNGEQITLGSGYTFNEGSQLLNSSRMTSLANNKFVVVRREFPTPYHGEAQIGTISGTVITYGTKADFSSVNWITATAVDSLSSSGFVVAWVDQTDSSKGKVAYGSVSGTTITYGSTVEYNAAGVTSYPSVAALSESGFIVSYRDQSSPGYGYARVGSISGTTITLGSASGFHTSGAVTDVSSASVDANRCVIAFRTAADSGHSLAKIATVSGTTITYGIDGEFHSGANGKWICIDNFHSSGCVVAYGKSSNNRGEAKIGTISGSDITFGSGTSFTGSGTVSNISCSAFFADRFVVSYHNSVIEVPGASGITLFGRLPDAMLYATNETTLYINAAPPTATKSATLYIFNGPKLVTDATTLYLEATIEASGFRDLYIAGREATTDSANLFIEGHGVATESLDLFLQGRETINDVKTLFIGGSQATTASRTLFINGLAPLSASRTLYIKGGNDIVRSATLYTEGHDLATVTATLFIEGLVLTTGTTDLFIGGQDTISVSGDLFINGHQVSTTSTTLYIKGDVDIVGSTTLFIEGQSSTTDSIDLFIQGHGISTASRILYINGTTGIIAISGSTTLYIAGGHSPPLYILGHNSITGQRDLFIDGHLSYSDSGNLFIHGHTITVDSKTLFINGTEVIFESGARTLFINGFEPKPSPACPILDPTAVIQIKDSLIRTYQIHIDALINQLGKNVLLEFDPIRSPCPNCTYDTQRKRSTGIYIPGGPRPFKRKRKCPWCKGRGLLETAVNKCIKCLVQWNPQDAEKYGISVERQKGIVRFKTYLTESDDLRRARTVLSNYDIAAQMQLRVKLVAGPIPVGLREDRYCISFWELI